MINALSDPSFKEVLIEHIDQGSRFSVSTRCVLAFYVDDVHDATSSTGRTETKSFFSALP
jgi:hypothetical protein